MKPGQRDNLDNVFPIVKAVCAAEKGCCTFEHCSFLKLHFKVCCFHRRCIFLPSAVLSFMIDIKQTRRINQTRAAPHLFQVPTISTILKQYTDCGRLSVCQEQGSQEVLAKHTPSVNRQGLMPCTHTNTHSLSHFCPHAQTCRVHSPPRKIHNNTQILCSSHRSSQKPVEDYNNNNNKRIYFCK